jgi:purine nucleosidase
VGEGRPPGVQRVALDTDIGTDVDDLLALATILGSPELELVAVTTVYGDTLLRARMVAKALRLAGVRGVPVVPGERRTASGREVWWAGHEGVLFGDLAHEQVDAALDAAETLAAAPTVLGIGPLTDVAAALRVPGRAVNHLVLMGGDFASGATEHNVRSDAVAAAEVFASGVQVTIVGVEQTERVHLRQEFLDDLAGRQGFGAVLAAEVEQYRAFSGRPHSVPHDVVAVLLCARPDLFTVVPGVISVVPEGPEEGRSDFAPDPGGPHRVVTGFDVAAVLAELEQRILRVVERNGP